MKLVIQRVREASVIVEGQPIARIHQGLVVLVGLFDKDQPQRFAEVVERLVNLRIFDDESGRLNRSLRDVQGALLLVPEITLAADLTSGHRPSFTHAAPALDAKRWFEEFVRVARTIHPAVETGRFQSQMVVELKNDGPVTFILEEPPPAFGPA